MGRVFLVTLLDYLAYLDCAKSDLPILFETNLFAERQNLPVDGFVFGVLGFKPPAMF